MHLKNTLSSLTTVCPQLRWQAIIRVRIQIRSKLMRSYLKINALCCRDYILSRNAIFSCIQPFPDVRLFNWPTNLLCYQLSKICLASIQHIKNFFQVLIHKNEEYTHSYIYVNNYGYLFLYNHSCIFNI